MSLFKGIAVASVAVALTFGFHLSAEVSEAGPKSPRDSFPAGVPPIPQPKSPVETFRELLAMSPAEQQRFLSSRPIQNQNRLRIKIREYQQLSPNVRELRLLETEMHYYLLPLMRAAAANREAQLAAIPESTREFIERRLAAWDQLPPAVQQELLENEATIRYFTEMGISTPDQQRHAIESMPASQRASLEAGISRWQAMPRKQRDQVFQRFELFFALNRKEQESALNTLSDSERRNIQKTLLAFSALSPDQRAQCVRSLQKYAELSPDERNRFMQNAELWRTMTPDQRQAWRDLVARLSSTPPMPPSANGAPPALPTPKPVLATNGN